MPSYIANITAWFKDAATRHPLIQHSDASSKTKRFFEIEWDEMLQNGQQLGIPKDAWYLCLEDYREEYDENDTEYISMLPVLRFWVIRSVKPGDLADKKLAYEEARAIARSIWSKLKKDAHDYLVDCSADVPDGVELPADVYLNTLKVDRLQHPMFTDSYGVSVMLKVRYNHEDADGLDTETVFDALP